MVDSLQSAFDDHRRLLDSKTVTNVERSIRNFKKGRKRGKATRFHQAVVESKELEHELELLHGGAQHIQQQQQHKVERVAIGIASPAFQCLKREVKFSYRKEYFQRFCDLLKDVIEFPPTIINTNSINSLEDWHKTIDGFSEMKSCKSAKKKLGRQLEKGKSAKKKVLRNDSSCDDNNSTNSTITADNKTTTTTPNQKLQLLYEEFIKEVIIPHLQEAMESEMVQQSSPCCISNNNNNNRNGHEHEHERTVDVEVETEFFVQAKPCIRFQQPSNKRTTIPHCDSFYGHQPGQINFWLPLTRSFGSNSLYSESEPGKRDFHSFDCNLNLLNNNNNNNNNHLLGDSVNGGHQEQSKICDCDNDNDNDNDNDIDNDNDNNNNDNDNGKMTIDTGNVTEMMRFYGNECVHFTEANRTEITRVSLDFRVVPGFVYDDDYVGSRHSENGRQLFKAAPEGEYYKLFRV